MWYLMEILRRKWPNGKQLVNEAATAFATRVQEMADQKAAQAQAQRFPPASAN
jgi:hypothetical protein